MIIQIRIVVDVPESDKLKYPSAIEKIVNCALEEFPDLQVARHSHDQGTGRKGTSPMKLGVDKSQLDGPANYDIMALRGISFVTMRASWETYTDTMYLNDAPKAMQAGIAVMPYHWYKPKIDPVKQAEVFLASVANSTANLPPMLDLEDNGRFVGYKGIATKELKIWLDIVEQKTQQTPYLYLSPDYMKSYLTFDTFLTRYPLLVANWDTNYPLLHKPFTPDMVRGWQFGDNRDAKYYGFMQAKGCALYAWTGEEYETQEWNR